MALAQGSVPGSGAIGRGSVLGFFLGILPGGGATIASMASYAMEKKRAKQPERFGKGAPEGVAGPETANNAAATSSFIPLLTLGIPANATMALMFGALLIQGVTPGPQLVEQDPGLFWGVRELHVHRQHPAVDHEPAARRGVREDPPGPGGDPGPGHGPDHAVGRLHHQQQHVRRHPGGGVRHRGLPHEEVRLRTGPLVLAFVLGSLLESSLRRSLLVFGGDPAGFFSRPISATLLAVFVLVAVLPGLRSLLAKRRAAARGPRHNENQETV